MFHVIACEHDGLLPLETSSAISGARAGFGGGGQAMGCVNGEGWKLFYMGDKVQTVFLFWNVHANVVVCAGYGIQNSVVRSVIWVLFVPKKKKRRTVLERIVLFNGIILGA